MTQPNRQHPPSILGGDYLVVATIVNSVALAWLAYMEGAGPKIMALIVFAVHAGSLGGIGVLVVISSKWPQ